MFENFKPLSDRVLLKRVEGEETTSGGIIIPESAKEKAQMGKVLAVGPGRRSEKGDVVPVAIKAGDVVYFGKFAGTDLGDDYLVIREDEILGIVEK